MDNFSGYRFGFQGQEGDDEIVVEGNSYAYKYRINDGRLGRFVSIDPLAPKYPHNSPYAFSENRVIDGIELEGLEFFDTDGIDDALPDGFIGPATVTQQRETELKNFLVNNGIDVNSTVTIGNRSYIDLGSNSLSYDPVEGYSLNSIDVPESGMKLHNHISGLPNNSAETRNDGDYFSPKAAEKAFDYANTYLNCYDMCTAASLARFGYVFSELDATLHSDDYDIANSITSKSGYGVGQALADKGLATLVSHDDILNGSLLRVAAIQYWRNGNPATVLSHLQTGTPVGGHSIIFHGYIYDINGSMSGFIYSDYGGFHRGSLNYSIIPETPSISARNRQGTTVSLFGANLNR